jgi:hypothetical protein
MYWNVTVHFGVSTIRPGQRDHFDLVAAPNKLMREHAHMEITPTN